MTLAVALMLASALQIVAASQQPKEHDDLCTNARLGRLGDRTHIGAERAFAVDAQKLGQWSAFRKWATPNAIMFVPKPVSAHGWLTGRADPPAAVRWQLADTYISSDGDTAINTGPTQWPDGSQGFFVTVWRQQPADTWRWSLDFGGSSTDAEITKPRKCDQWTAQRAGGGAPTKFEMPRGATGGGHSADYTLRWWYDVRRDGTRTFRAEYWSNFSSSYKLAVQRSARD